MRFREIRLDVKEDQMVRSEYHISDLWDNFEVNGHDGDILDSDSYIESYRHYKSILKSIPKKELLNRGWIDDSENSIHLSTLFLNIHKNRLNGLFRKSSVADSALLAAWHSRIYFIAQMIVSTGIIPNFKGLSSDDLKEIGKLSQDVSNIKKIPDILAKKGIVVIYERSLPGMKSDGVVFKIGTGNPIIGLSFRYKRLDYFWFTLMHELSHIVLHEENLFHPIFDDIINIKKSDNDLIEGQANRLAKNSFIEKYKWRNCKPKYTHNDKDVIEFAKENEIHSAIVAGFLQMESNDYRKFRNIVDEFDIRELIFDDE